MPLLSTDPVSAGYSTSAAGVPEVNVEHKTIHRELSRTTRNTLKRLQLHSKIIPALGIYIAAVAEVGLDLMEIVEVEAMALLSSVVAAKVSCLGDGQKRKRVKQSGAQPVGVSQVTSRLGGTVEATSRR